MASATCVKNLTESLTKFEEGVARLQECCDKVGTEEDSQRIRDRMEKEKEAVAKLRAPIRTQFTELKKLEKDEESGYYSELSARWGTAWNKFGELQRICKKKVKEPFPSAMSRPLMDDSRCDDEEDPHSINGGIQLNQLKRYDLSAAQTEEAIQREKAQDISELEVGMIELHTMYQEFGDMVVEQAKPLEQVVENLDNAQTNVREGTSNLQSASDYQKSSRKKMCCLIILVLVIIIILVVVVTVAAK
eukprot:TRINITY_DN2992_c0_g3_i1.p1 TRINITY_DN2992_c0_g3~~TRINITY_DN2992_c0_g3_i1.p1  ORF type:complete len:247 (+),score=65.44 TRINITY_DN2992_c0_g3_i1:51-791(+)